MNSVFIVHSEQNSEDGVVAVFTSLELANAFAERHPRFHGCYRIEEKNLNPFFERTDKWLYLVIIDPNEPCLQAHQISSFDEEQLAYHSPVSKYEDTFYFYVFANNKNDALLIGQAKFEEMIKSGEWQILKDGAD